MDRVARRLAPRWRALLAPLGAPESELREVFADLVARHAAPERRHHTLRRTAHVLGQVDELEHRAQHPEPAYLAAWLATAEFQPGQGPDRGASARYAEWALGRMKLPADLIREVQRLILLADGGTPADDDGEGQVVNDAELSELALSNREYLAHARELRGEQPGPDAQWRAQRLPVVRALLERDSIFRTPEMRAGREGLAQLNLAREEARLVGVGPEVGP